MEEKFSNLEIGFEPTDDPPKVYVLPLEALVVVLSASLPWHATVQNLNTTSLRQKVEVIHQTLRNSEFNDAVLSHEFLNCHKFRDLLACTCKFAIKKPEDIVEKLVRNC